MFRSWGSIGSPIFAEIEEGRDQNGTFLGDFTWNDPYQICSNRSEPCSVKLLLMTSVQLCICDSRKGHLRSYNDVMVSTYVFAYNF